MKTKNTPWWRRLLGQKKSKCQTPGKEQVTEETTPPPSATEKRYDLLFIVCLTKTQSRRQKEMLNVWQHIGRTLNVAGAPALCELVVRCVVCMLAVSKYLAKDVMSFHSRRCFRLLISSTHFLGENPPHRASMKWICVSKTWMGNVVHSNSFWTRVWVHFILSSTVRVAELHCLSTC